MFEELIEDFILEVACAKVEEPDELRKMIGDISYPDDKDEVLEKVTGCEVVDCEDYDIIDLEHNDETTIMTFMLEYVLQVFTGDEIVWRVTGSCRFRISIPGENEYDWSFAEDAEDRDDLLKHKDIVRFISTEYSDIEADAV